MNSALAATLQSHLSICEEVLTLLMRENQLLQTADRSHFEICQARKALLPRLDASLRQLRTHAGVWRSLPAEEKRRSGAILQILKQTQAAIMKALTLDRENEQCLLRRGLIPARQLPPASCQRQHFVADLYRRNRLASV